MKMKWQKNGENINERTALALITQSSARPVCAIPIGVESNLKSEVFENFLKPITRSGFNGAWLLSQTKENPNMTPATLELQPDDIFYVDMYEDAICDPKERQRLVAAIRKLDVMTVIGIFIDSFSERGEPMQNRMSYSGGMGYVSGNICTRLHENPPQVGEFDVLLTVTEE